mmetsp:Transcript_6720/g.18476  ORF Transcript_6720/g.18476 Transcript_6720/m.18476 type:complete len:304 (+) Transcript_6720:883-1794(+)
MALSGSSSGLRSSWSEGGPAGRSSHSPASSSGLACSTSAAAASASALACPCTSAHASAFCLALRCQSSISARAIKRGILEATASKNCVSMPCSPFCRFALISISMSSSSRFVLEASKSWISETTPSATPVPKPFIAAPGLRPFAFSRCLASMASWQTYSMAFQKALCRVSCFTKVSISPSMSSTSVRPICTKIWWGGLSRMVISSNSSPSAIARPFATKSTGRSRPCSMRIRLRTLAFSRWNFSSLASHSPYSSSCISLSCSSRCCSRSLLSTSRSSRRFLTWWISRILDSMRSTSWSLLDLR